MQSACCSFHKEKKAEKGIEIDLLEILIFYSTTAVVSLYTP